MPWPWPPGMGTERRGRLSAGGGLKAAVAHAMGVITLEGIIITILVPHRVRTMWWTPFPWGSKRAMASASACHPVYWAVLGRLVKQALGSP